MHRRDPLGSYASWALVVLFASMSVLLLAELCLSLRWRMEHDSPLMHYVAFSIDRFGSVPYRDLFDLNFPGVFLLHLAIGRTLGYGDLAFRVVDLFYVVALAGLTWRLTRPLGGRVAWGAALLFPLNYLSHGPEMSLQRDTVAILPIAAASVLATARTGRHRPVARALVAGALFGLAGSLKPHLAIGLPVLLAYMCLEDQPGSRPTRAHLASMCLAAVAADSSAKARRKG